jgi:hypothetical protein
MLLRPGAKWMGLEPALDQTSTSQGSRARVLMMLMPLHAPVHSSGLNYVTACACLYDTSMLASMIYLWATIRGLSLLVTTSLSSGTVTTHAPHRCIQETMQDLSICDERARSAVFLGV